MPPQKIENRKSKFKNPLAAILLTSLLATCISAPVARQLQSNDPAPDFALKDAHTPDSAPPLRLSDLAQKSPVLLIFYEGYSCPRCVTHLQMIDDTLDQFKAAHLQVLAISSDTPEQTRDSIKEFGDFNFPLLFDRNGAIARTYGVDGQNNHGAFIIDQSNHIRFAYTGDHPFMDFPAVLTTAAKIRPQ